MHTISFTYTKPGSEAQRVELSFQKRWSIDAVMQTAEVIELAEEVSNVEVEEEL